jgi:biotin synthase
MSSIEIRYDWTREQALSYYKMPLLELIDLARSVHLSAVKKHSVQLSTLYNVKTGACPEDCSYCSQSRHHNTNLSKESLVPLEKTIEKAMDAKKNGATRFCMGAAWRSPKKHQLEQMCDMIKAVKDLGLETCATLGMLSAEQAQILQRVGLDYYNHNLDTSESYYPKIITTRTYQDRLETLKHVRDAGMKVCCGGILGLGESIEDRLDLLITLANLNPHPESVPINQLAQVPGTPLENAKSVKEIDYIRTIALARILMPKSYVRLSAGREKLSESGQTLCFMAGANSIFLGPKLLTTTNPSIQTDESFLKNIGLEAQIHE